MKSESYPSIVPLRGNLRTRSEAYARWVVRWRWPVLLGTLVLAAAAISGVRYLGVDDDYRVYFNEEDPRLRALEALEAVYSTDDRVLFALAPAAGDVFTPRALDAVERLTRRGWQMPYATRVDSLTNFQLTRADGDDLVIEDLVSGALEMSPEELRAVRHAALSDRRLVANLVSPEGHVAGVVVTFSFPQNDKKSMRVAALAARELAGALEREVPEIAVRVTGSVMLNNAFLEAVRRDSRTLIPLMFAAVVLILSLLLRSPGATFAAVSVICLSAGTAVGLAGWLGILLTLPSATAPNIILSIAVANCVHLLVSFLERRRRGAPRGEATVAAVRLNVQPIFLTSLTTAIGFVSLNSADSPPLRDLGNIAAMGVAAAFLYSLLLLPALLAVLPIRVRARAGQARRRPIERFAELILHRRRPLLWGMSLAVVALALSIPANEIDDNFVEYFEPGVPFRDDTAFVTRELTGIFVLEYSLRAATSGGISDPAYLEKLEEFAEWFRQQDGVTWVGTLSEDIKQLNRSLHGDDPSFYRLPASRELAAQYLLLYEMSLPYGQDLNNRVNVDKSATRFTVRLEDPNNQELLRMAARAEAWLRRNAPAHMFAPAANRSILFAHISERNIRGLLVGGVMAFFAIALTLVVALKSVRLGLLSLVPNLTPAVMAFGLWGILVGRVNFGLSIVTVMTLGIVVDDTVHFLTRYLRARREQGEDPEGAVRHAFASVGTPLWVTTLVLVAGFAVLAQSSFSPNADMGLLVAITLSVALAADFLLLPPLLVTLEGSKAPSGIAGAAKEPLLVSRSS